MVETPFFSKETVDKEKGIIAEEIKMYQNNLVIKLCLILYVLCIKSTLLKLI